MTIAFMYTFCTLAASKTDGQQAFHLLTRYLLPSTLTINHCIGCHRSSVASVCMHIPNKLTSLLILFGLLTYTWYFRCRWFIFNIALPKSLLWLKMYRFIITVIPRNGHDWHYDWYIFYLYSCRQFRQVHLTTLSNPHNNPAYDCCVAELRQIYIVINIWYKESFSKAEGMIWSMILIAFLYDFDYSWLMKHSFKYNLY